MESSLWDRRLELNIRGWSQVDKIQEPINYLILETQEFNEVLKGNSQVYLIHKLDVWTSQWDMIQEISHHYFTVKAANSKVRIDSNMIDQEYWDKDKIRESDKKAF